MPHDLPKAYDPTAIEDHWAEYWVRENLFAQPSPESNPAQPGAKRAEGDQEAGTAFTILLPPPNVTGRLHMGHMLNQTEMDILTRGIACAATPRSGSPAPTTPASPPR